MRKRKIGIWANMAGTVVGLSLLAITCPTVASDPDDLLRQPKVDDRVDPLTQAQRGLHKKAIEASLKGKAYGKTHEVARGQYVELERQGS